MKTRPEIEIIFEDTHLLVLNKPAGLLSQGDQSGDENLVDWLREYLGRPYVGLIHRLDRNTSGILLVAKRTKSASRLSQSLMQRQIDRRYFGIAGGDLVKATRWEDWIEKNSKDNISKITNKENPNGKKAVTHAIPLIKKTLGNLSITCCQFILESGRSHQIRIQCSHHGNPLIGDHKYGSPEYINLFERPALHAISISFPHPMSKEIMTFECSLPNDMKKLLDSKEVETVFKGIRESR